jgi:hypothetical protein
MKHQALLGIFFSLLIVLLPARKANAFIELNAFYFTDTMSAATTPSSNRMFIETTLGFMVDKNGQYLVGWAYGMFNATDNNGSAVTYASTQMGPRFVWNMDKQHHWSLGLGYYLISKASFNAGTDEQWKGSAIKADIGYNLDIAERFQLGLRLNYSAASYTEKLIGSSTYSTIGYTRTFMYPSVYSIYMF